MKWLFTQSIVSVLFAGVFVGAFLFVSNRIHTYHARADALATSVALSEQKIANSEAQRKVLRQIDQEHINIGDFFFREGDALTLIRILEAAADVRAMPASTLSVENNVDARSPLGAYIVTLELKGTFADIISFLGYVETLPYALRITGFTISLVQDDTNTSWTATVSVAGAYVTARYQK